LLVIANRCPVNRVARARQTGGSAPATPAGDRREMRRSGRGAAALGPMFGPRVMGGV
jgi:hypothetical protein